MRQQQLSLIRRPAHVSRDVGLAPSRRGPSLRFEALESRWLLAVTVDTVLDVVDASDGVTSLREAIIMTNTTDETTINFSTTGVLHLIDGELEITDTLLIEGPGQELFTIDAQWNSRLLSFTAVTGDLTLSGLTLMGGQPTNSDGGGIRFDSDGALTVTESTISGNRRGGIFANSGDVLLTDSVVHNNSSTAAGSGIATRSGNVTLSSSTVSGNVSYSSGGGIATESGNVSLTGSAVNDNRSTGYWPYGGGSGGGISTNSGRVTLVSSEINGNSTLGKFAHGGGISTSSGRVTLTNSTVSGNSTAGLSARGGGISALDAGRVSLNQSIVSGNNSRDAGGGIHTLSSSIFLTDSTISDNHTSGRNAHGGGISTNIGRVSLTDSTVSGNTTTGQSAGGGGISMSSGTGIISLSASTVSGNFSYASGGGISTSYGSGTLSLIGSTVSGNTTTGNEAHGGGISTGFRTVSLASTTVNGNTASASGGGIFIQDTVVSPTLSAENTIIGSNTAATSGPDIAPDPDGTLTVRHSLIGVADGLDITGGIGNLTGTESNPLDPLLGPLTNNGGPTFTQALLPGSPAVNAGDPDFDPMAWYPAVVYDQRGYAFARVADGRIDIGATESGATSADFDRSETVDGSDFLAWQRGFGATSPTHQNGDANLDLSVDASDLALWSAAYGDSLPAELHGLSAIQTDSVEKQISSPETSNFDAIDAAMALHWQISEGRKATAWAAEPKSVEAAITASSDAVTGLPLSTASEESQSQPQPQPTSRPHDAPPYTNEPWLAEELVERVFG